MPEPSAEPLITCRETRQYIEQVSIWAKKIGRSILTSEYRVQIVLWTLSHKSDLWDVLVITISAIGAVLVAFSVQPFESASFGGVPPAIIIQSRFDFGIRLIIIGYILQLLPIFTRTVLVPLSKSRARAVNKSQREHLEM